MREAEVEEEGVGVEVAEVGAAVEAVAAAAVEVVDSGVDLEEADSGEGSVSAVSAMEVAWEVASAMEVA